MIGKAITFLPRPKPLPTGDHTTDPIFLAVGRALNEWEICEEACGRLFNITIRPERSSYPARRAYSSLISAKSRREMIDASAEVFFRNFPSVELEKSLSDFMTLYNDGGARRNDIAHGVVLPHGPTPQYKGFYLGPNFYHSKRGLELESPYYYTSDQINEFTDLVRSFTIKLHHLCERLRSHYFASPEKSRERY